MERLLWPLEKDRTASNLFGGFIKPNVNKYQTGGLQHLLASQIKLEVGDEVFDNYFKFAFVRNPWDKCVSQYLFSMRKQFLLKILGVRKPIDFKKYLELIKTKTHVQWASQYSFVYNNSGDLMVDRIGRFEDFNQDVTSILGSIDGLCIPLEAGDVPHEKKSERDHYSTYYDNESMEIVSEIYRKDIEIFGYEF